MAYQPISKTGDGSTKSYSITFEYLRRAYVHATINGIETTDFSVDSSGILTFNTAPTSGAKIIFYRETPTTKLVSWADASVLKAKDMTIQQVQQLHIIEEEKVWIQENSVVLNDDDEWDMRNHRVMNVAQPIGDNDAVTKIYVDNEEKGFKQTITSIITNANTVIDGKVSNASTSATNAKTSETNAKSSETKAKTSETNAKTSETNAKTSETNAKTSETNAKSSETKAKTSETNAKTSETNAHTDANAAHADRLVADADVTILDDFIDSFVSMSIAPPITVLDSAHIMVTPTIDII